MGAILFWYGIPGVAYVTLALEAGQVVLSCTAQGMSLGCRGTISRDQGLPSPFFTPHIPIHTKLKPPTPNYKAPQDLGLHPPIYSCPPL